MTRATRGMALGAVLRQCGAFTVVVGATVGIGIFGVRAPALGTIAVGAVALIVGLLLSRRVREHDAPMRRRASLGQDLVAVIALVAVFVGGHVLASRVTWRHDVTSARVNTLTPESLRVAEALHDDVEVQGYFEGGERSFIELEALVARYHAANARIRLVRISPQQDVAQARAAGVLDGGPRVVVVIAPSDPARRRDGKVVFAAGQPDQEERLTNALRALTTTTKPRVYALAGHAEREISDDGPQGLSRLAQALSLQGLELVPLPLGALTQVPDDARAVLVVDALQAIPAAEEAMLTSWLERGGRLVVAAEPDAAPTRASTAHAHAPPALSSLLAAFGVQFVDDVVIDPTPFSVALGGIETASGVSYAAHPITRPLGVALTHFLRARSIVTIPTDGVTTTSLVQSSAEAWGESKLIVGRAPSLDDDEVAGPVTLLLLAERTSAPGRIGRVVVAGDATFLTNTGLTLGANRDLAVNTVLWLADDDAHIDVRPNRRGGNLLFLTPSARERLAFVLLVLVPVLVACAGIATATLRRLR